MIGYVVTAFDRAVPRDVYLWVFADGAEAARVLLRVYRFFDDTTMTCEPFADEHELNDQALIYARQREDLMQQSTEDHP